MSTATETPMRRRRDRSGEEAAMRDAMVQDTERVAIPADGEAHDRIARRAYELFEARGRQDGYDVDDWLAAERELAVPAGNVN